MEGIDY
ncbi:hypothetical protein RDI58_020885 [Solanum bulbocastanum]